MVEEKTVSKPFGFLFQTIEILSENPYTLLLYVLGMLQTLSLYIVNFFDPVYILQTLLNEIIQDVNLPKIIRMLALNLQKFLIYELKNRKNFVIFYMMFIPTLLDYSLAYLVFEILVALILIFSVNIPLWLIILLVHCWYLYRFNVGVSKLYVVVFVLFLLYFLTQLEKNEEVLNVLDLKDVEKIYLLNLAMFD